MTDDIRRKVVSAAADARDRRGHRWMAVAGAVAVLSFLTLAALLWARGNELQTEVATLAASDQDNHNAAQQLAEQVRKLGGTPEVSPPPGPSGAQGPVGPAGAAGRGITGTAISAGHLFVAYSDGSTEDKGQVVGAAGAAGRGITGANATSGHLVLSYSDGSTSDAGAVVGPQGAVGATGPTGANGRGIKSVSTAGGELVVTFDDGTSSDAGPLPAGPPGPAGPQGQPGADGKPPAGWTWTDTLGRTYTCARNASSPDNAPTYTCTAAPILSTAARPTR